MKSSEQINEIAAALAKAQGVIENPAKDSKNPHFNSRYADLAAGLNAVRAALSANGIAVVQATSLEGETMMLETKLAHTSGQWISSDYPVCRFPTKHQEAGSALTYARRYSLFSLIGIAGDDDDGNEASKSETPAPARKAAPPREPSLSIAESADERDELLDDISGLWTREDLHEWATKNSSRKGRLLPNDQGIVSAAFGQRQKQVKDGIQPPQAAE